MLTEVEMYTSLKDSNITLCFVSIRPLINIF